VCGVLAISLCYFFAPCLSYSEQLTLEKKNAIKELLNINGAMQQVKLMSNAMSQRMTNMAKKSMPEIDPKFFDVIEEEVKVAIRDELFVKESLYTFWYPIYNNYFTLNEINGLIQFYKTPLGRKTISVMPKMTLESMKASQAWMQSMIHKFQKIKWRILDRLKKEGIEISPDNADTECERFYSLNNDAKSHFDAKKYAEARKYANELLLLADNYTKNWNYGNAIYDAHYILGRLAILDNDINLAKKHLFAAVKTPGSPQLNSFGPNMALAKDLLEKGQKEAVIEFLYQCKKFWTNHEQINKWVKDIKDGKTPYFGANLLY